MGTIVLTESPGNHVRFNLVESSFEYIMEYSITLKLQFGDTLHAELQRRINSDHSDTNWSGIEYLTMVFLRKEKPTNLPEPLLRLFSIDTDEDEAVVSNGLIVSMDPNMKVLHKPKRTSGKVSNTLG